MSQTTSHRIQPGTAVTVAYPTTGPSAGYAVLHRTGCSHTKRQDRYNESHALGAWGIDFEPYADDYFEVAPCARAKTKKGA